MPRTVIEFPSSYHFSTEYQVLISDINSANHLGADKLFSIMIEAQMRFLAHFGYHKSAEIEGVGYIMGDTEFVFKAESVHADRLTIDMAACHFNDKSFELRYRVTNTTKNAVAAYIKAGMVFIDYNTGVPQRVPSAFREKFSNA